MSDNTKQIQDWQEQVRSSFGDESRLYQYLFETMDNFYYRYLETSLNKNLTTQELSARRWGAMSFENSMVEALKIKNLKARPHLIEFAKSIPKSQNPMVRYGLWVEVNQLSPEEGEMIFTAEINWGFPDFNDSSKRLKREVKFTYGDLGQFRKELALKLEEVSEIFT